MRQFAKFAAIPLLVLVVLAGLFAAGPRLPSGTTSPLMHSATAPPRPDQPQPGYPAPGLRDASGAAGVPGISIAPAPPTGGGSDPSGAPLNKGTWAENGAPAAAAAPTGISAPAPGLGPPPPMGGPNLETRAAAATPADFAAPGASSGAPLQMGNPPPAVDQAPLTAGQIDDNARFAEYLDYLQHYQGPAILPIAVERRLFVRVLDASQHPVAGARVQLFDGARPVFDARTVSDGRVLFFPAAAGATQAPQLRALVSRGSQQVTASLAADQPAQTVALPALQDNTGPVGLDLVFLLDATGSMGDEIDKIKATVATVASRIQQLPGSTAPRFGLVAFRDRGDDYITRSWDFTADVRTFQQNLANVAAGGGGDNPESVNAGLDAAIHLPGWTAVDSGRHLRMIVLVGDAPPHLDYPNDTEYPQLLQEAVAAGITICPIGASGLDDQGEYIFRQFAEVTQGQFIFLTYANGQSGAPGVVTDHHVSNFTVNDLDTLVVNLVAHDIANQVGPAAQGSAPAPLGNLDMLPPAALPPAAGGWPETLAGLVAPLTRLLTAGSLPVWLLLLVPLVVWAARRSPGRARRNSPATIAFTAPGTGLPAEPPGLPPPWHPQHAARVTPERTTTLPAALAWAAPPSVAVYPTIETSGRPTAPLPPLPERAK